MVWNDDDKLYDTVWIVLEMVMMMIMKMEKGKVMVMVIVNG